MAFASHLARGADLRAAVAEACAAVKGVLPEPNILFPFLRAADPNDYRRLPELLAEHFPGVPLFGCGAAGVIADGHEEEDGPALALSAAKLPGTITLSYLDPDAILVEGQLVAERIAAEVKGTGDLLIVVDPFTLSPDALLVALDEAIPGANKLGALSSAGPVTRSSMLYGRTAHRRGALVLRLGEEVRLRPIVAQGCRPVGRPHVITRVDDQAIIELDGKPALDALQALFKQLDAVDREIFRHSLFVGIEMDKSTVEVRTDRLLVRNLLGVNPAKGSIGVATTLKVYDVMHFVLRDSKSAELELATLLAAAKADGAAPFGALLFTCLGRGRHLFGSVDHDPEMFKGTFGPLPIGGFFANGEIAPVGGRTFLHGYTSAFAMFELVRG